MRTLRLPACACTCLQPGGRQASERGAMQTCCPRQSPLHAGSALAANPTITAATGSLTGVTLTVVLPEGVSTSTYTGLRVQVLDPTYGALQANLDSAAHTGAGTQADPLVFDIPLTLYNGYGIGYYQASSQARRTARDQAGLQLLAALSLFFPRCPPRHRMLAGQVPVRRTTGRAALRDSQQRVPPRWIHHSRCAQPRCKCPAVLCPWRRAMNRRLAPAASPTRRALSLPWQASRPPLMLRIGRAEALPHFRYGYINPRLPQATSFSCARRM